MSLVQDTIPNLINGVSQQPFAIRLPTQAEAMVNGDASAVEGLTKRPPTRHSARISTSPLTACHVHVIDRDATERYEVIITDGDLQVFDLAGNEKTVTFPDGTDYLDSVDAENDFAAVTVADYTFIANKSVTVAEDAASVLGTRPFETLIWVREAEYKRTYSVTIGSTVVTFKTGDSSSPANQEWVQTDMIALGLYQMLTAGVLSGTMTGHGTGTISGGVLPGGFTATLLGSTIYISKSSDYLVTSSDGGADNAMHVIKGTAQRFTDLPAKGVDGFIARVQGEADNEFDDYYVEYVADANNPNGGVWAECAKPGENSNFDAATMPHTLVRNIDGTFTFAEAVWEPRACGSLDVTPFPSFTGRTIADVFFNRNRLGFLSDENTVTSRAGDFFNFFRKSAIQQLDTDPIDIAGTHTKVSLLKYAVPFNSTVILFSDPAQFNFKGGDILTPKNAALPVVSEYKSANIARPVSVGKSVYFAANRGGYSALYDYHVSLDNSNTNTADEVTAQAPKYIPGNVRRLAVSPEEQILVALSGDDRSALYVYRFYTSEDEVKLQSAPYKWQFPATDTILDVAFIDSDLRLVVSRPDGLYLESMLVDPGRIDAGGSFTVRLDRRMDETQCAPTYNAVPNTTTFSVPYTLEAGEVYEVIAWYDDETYRPGQKLPYTSQVVGTYTVITVARELTKFMFGRRYEFRYRFSPFVYRAASQNGGTVTPEGRLQVLRASVNYANSGYFRVEVTPRFRDTYTTIFTGTSVGSQLNPLGSIGIESGTFKFPVSSKNDQVTIDLVNDTYLPCAFLSAAWKGNLTRSF